MIRRLQRVVLSVVALSALLVPLGASAELGGDMGSVQRDRAKMKASLTVQQRARYSVHEMKAASGSLVREFVSPDGKVFGVAWQGAFHPDYQQLLGAYFDRLSLASRNSRARRAPVMIEQNGFVFQSFGHFRSLAGRAFLTGMVPQGVGTEEIQ